MAGINGSCVAYNGVSHKYGFLVSITVTRSSSSNTAVHIEGVLNSGAWDLYSSSWEGTDLNGTLYVGTTSHAYSVYHSAFSTGHSGSLLNSTRISFDLEHPNSNPIKVWGNCYNGVGDSASNSWYIYNIPSYTAPAVDPPDADTVSAFGTDFETAEEYTDNPNGVFNLPKNIVVDKRYTNGEWNTLYHITTEENIYKYPPVTRSLGSNYGKIDQYNIPFDVNESESNPKWCYYDNTYFYIYKDGIYDLSCNAMTSRRASGVGPKDYGRNVDGNDYAWVKIGKNPSGNNCTFLSGQVSKKYGDDININVHCVVPLKSGDKVFARFGWQYGNTNTSSGVSVYDMHCELYGGLKDKTTRMTITPLVFLEKTIDNQ